MKHTLTFTILLYSAMVQAQNCSTESLLQKSGNWKETSASSSGILAADLAREKKTIATINTMIKSKYSPMGVYAYVNGGYNSPYPNIPVNNYIYSIIPLDFYCDGNDIKTARETATYFHIAVNSFQAEIFDTAQGDRLLMECFHVLPQIPKQKDGYYYFDEIDEGKGLGVIGKSRKWLITYDGKLPWAYATKKEFLEKRRRSLDMQKTEEASHIREVLRNNEITKGFKEKEFKNDPEKLQKFMRLEYQPMKERYEKLLTEIDKKYKSAFEKLEEQLKKPATELSEMAIVKIDPKDHLSYLFTDEKDPFGKILIKPNPGYFNKKLPRSVPQFISIYVAGDPKDPIAAKAMTGMVNAIDFTLLKNMLGK